MFNPENIPVVFELEFKRPSWKHFVQAGMCESEEVAMAYMNTFHENIRWYRQNGVLFGRRVDMKGIRVTYRVKRHTIVTADEVRQIVEWREKRDAASGV